LSGTNYEAPYYAVFLGLLLVSTSCETCSSVAGMRGGIDWFLRVIGHCGG